MRKFFLITVFILIPCYAFLQEPANPDHHAACKANFIFELDSLNHHPNTYRFIDRSEGFPNHYKWTFGDGTVQFMRDPIHQFRNPGTYNVCLEITREVQGSIQCRDSVCSKVVTANYRSLGGHLFAGKYPINNPVPTGDTGFAFLYRKSGPKLIPYDSVKFTYLGYFAFPSVLEGSYLIRAELSRGSSGYRDFMPSYYSKQFEWIHANEVHLRDSNVFHADIDLMPLPEFGQGPGGIAGTVSFGGPGDFMPRIDGAEVILFDPAMNPLRFSLTDKHGRFDFMEVPFGAYYLYVDYPGKYSRLTSVWLDEKRPVAGDLFLEIFDQNVTGVDPGDLTSLESGRLYPNPAHDQMTAVVIARQDQRVTVELTDITGKTLVSSGYDCVAGTNNLVVPLGDLQVGIYLLTVKNSAGGRIIVKKVLKF